MLETALSGNIRSLADSYGLAAKGHQALTDSIDELVQTIKKAAAVRNIWCHASWAPPDQEGESVPYLVNYKFEIFEVKIDASYLHQVYTRVIGLICDVVDSVTQMGVQFPGSEGPGKPVWPSNT